MGVMTLALSAFSIVPMAISLSKRTHLAQVVTHILNEYGKDGNQVRGVGLGVDPPQSGPARVEDVGNGAGPAPECRHLT